MQHLIVEQRDFAAKRGVIRGNTSTAFAVGEGESLDFYGLKMSSNAERSVAAIHRSGGLLLVLSSGYSCMLIVVCMFPMVGVDTDSVC